MSTARRLPGRDDLGDVAAVLTLTAVALVAFRSSYGGSAFFVIGLLGVVLGAAVVEISWARRWSFAVSAGLAVITYGVLCPVLTLRHYAIGGVVPGPRALVEGFTSAVTGWKELITTTPPVGGTGDLLVIPFVATMTSTFAALSLLRRSPLPALSVAPILVLLGLGIAVGIDTPVSVVLHGGVLAVLILGWLSWKEQHRRPLLRGDAGLSRRILSGLAVLVAGAVVGFVAAPALPGIAAAERDVWRDTVIPPFDPRQYPSPLAGYRDYVKPGYDAAGAPNEDEVMFTVEGLPEALPIRLATMDTYDGLVWQVSGGEQSEAALRRSGAFQRVGSAIEPDTDGEVAEVTVTIGAYADVWVPDVGEVTSIRFEGSADGPERDRELAASFRYNRSTDTGATVVGLREGDRYVMTVRLPNRLDDLATETILPDVDALGSAEEAGLIQQRLVTSDLLAVDDTGQRLDQMRALMREGVYSDGDRQAGQILTLAGHSEARMSEFVQDFPGRPLLGNAEQYASAYALLFRSLGQVPTRVVMGFVPSAGSLDEPVEVFATEAEAWVEVPVEDLGWVAIFPTPDRDRLSAQTNAPQQPEPDYRTQVPPPPPLVDPEFDEPALSIGEAEETAQEDDEAQSGDESAVLELLAHPYLLRAGVVSSPVLLALGVAASIMLMKTLRRRRRRSSGPGHQRIANGWREVTDLAIDMGRPVPPSTTRREAAAFVGPASLVLAERADAAIWSGGDLDDATVEAYWQELVVVLESMKSELGLVDRLKANVSLQSLRRSRPEPDGRRSGAAG